MTARAPAAAGPTAWPAAWACALLVLGGLSLASAWSGVLPALCLTAAAVGPLVVCRGVLRLGISAWATTSVLVTLLVLGAYLLAADAGTSFADTVTDAVPRLLTTPRPLPVRADVLVGPLLLTALVSLLVGIRLGSRRRVAPVVGGLGLYVSGALLTSGEGDRWGLLASLLVACALLGWVVLDGHGAGRRIALVVPAALAATGMLVVSTTVQWSTPFEPRTLVDPPAVDVVASNPLAHLGTWTGDPDRVLLDVSGPVVPLRLVTLDSYDGNQWSAATRYRPVPEAEPPATPPPGRSTRSATVSVDVVDVPGRWLPSPGWPTAVSADGAVVEPVSGNLYLPTADAARDLSYTVTATADTPDAGRLASATVPDRDDLARYLALPALPPPLTTFAERSVAGAVTPYDRAVAIETMLHERARVSPTAVSGSQLWRITTFLLAAPGTVGARIGTAEQFATSFAVLARHNGLPTRVVVGFRPDARDQQAGGDGWTVRGRHATAWPEVYFQDLGWVPFSPTEARRAPGRPESEGTVEVGRGDDAGIGGTTEDVPRDTSPDRPGEDPAAPGEPGAAERWSALAAGVAGVALAFLVLLLSARAIRTRRHLRLGPAGAWAEARDALRLAGLRVLPHLTADQVADLARERLGTDAVHVLAADSQRSAFGPPGTTGGDPGPALRVVRREARRSVPLWRRWWWPFDPSVFVS